MATLTPTERTEKQNRIQALIDGAQGAEDMIRTSALSRMIFHTDSLDAVCREAGAFWFLDVIVSHLPRIVRKYGHRAEFQVWQMTVKKNREARIWCEDGDGNKLVAQIIPYTDFPLESLKVFYEYGSIDGKNPAYIIMLPGDR